MASPQLEDGYTRISNELLEEIFRCEFNGSQLRVLLCLLRNTYGYGRKECDFSTGFVMKALGSDKKNTSVVIKSLIDSHVIKVVREASYTSARKVSLNKNYDEWKVRQPEWASTPTGGKITNRVQQHQQCTVTPTPTVGEVTNRGGGDVTNQKRNILKKDIKDNIYEHFFEQAWHLYPKKRGKSSVSKKAKKELYDAGIENVAPAIEAYKEEAMKMDEQYILYGSTFFNGRWKDYAPAAVALLPREDAPQEQEEPVIDLWTEGA